MTVAKLQHDKLYMTRRQLAAADDLVSDNLYLQGMCKHNVGGGECLYWLTEKASLNTDEQLKSVIC